MADDPPPASDFAPTPPDSPATPEPAAAPAPEPAAPAAPGPVSGIPESATSQEDANQAAIDELLRQASFEDASAAVPAPAAAIAAPPPPDAAPFELPNLQQVMQEAQVSSIDLLRDVDLNVKIELGRSRMLVEDVLKLSEGSVVELDKLAGDPVDVFVNDRLVARGEVLVLNDNFCVRVNEIVSGLREEGV